MVQNINLKQQARVIMASNKHTYYNPHVFWKASTNLKKRGIGKLVMAKSVVKLNVKRIFFHAFLNLFHGGLVAAGKYGSWRIID